MKKRINSLLALLVLGSASLVAQIDDPFPAVNMGKYQDVMMISMGQVRLGGKILREGSAIVAVYCGDEIRGKGPIRSSKKYPDIINFNIQGERTAPGDLHFKVYDGGRIIEVDQGLKFVVNGKLGEIGNYYYIDLPEPVVTTPSTEGWATTCLPFNAEVPDGVTVWNATGIENGELVMTKLTGNILPKNVPVLLLESTGKTSYEWLSRVADGNITADGSIFSGTTETATVAANSVLTLGHNDESGEIGFWRFTGTTIPANRAYIANAPAGAKGVRIVMDETTGIARAANAEESICWYTLGGTRLSHQPTAKGVYVRNGRKVVIK